jgi:hypothetical protein
LLLVFLDAGEEQCADLPINSGKAAGGINSAHSMGVFPHTMMRFVMR